jgi:hypothetical protein
VALSIAAPQHKTALSRCYPLILSHENRSLWWGIERDPVLFRRRCYEPCCTRCMNARFGATEGKTPGSHAVYFVAPRRTKFRTKREPLVSPSESGPMCYRAGSARTRHETTVKRPMRELRFFAMIAGRRWNIAGSNRKPKSRWHQDGRRNTSVSAQGTMHHGQVQWSKSPQDSVTAFAPSETAQGCGILTLGNIS